MADNLNLSISDPISADIQAVCKAAEALFTFLGTEEGQAVCKQWRTDAAAWNTAIQKAGAWIEGIFRAPVKAVPPATAR